MFKSYLWVAKAANDQSLRFLAASWGLPFLGSPLSLFIGSLFAPMLAVQIMQGIVSVEFELIEFRNSKDKKKYLEAVKLAKNADKGLSKEEREKLVQDIKKATIDSISIKKYLRDK